MFERRLSESPYIKRVWRAQPDVAGDYMDLASQYWHIVFDTEHGETKVLLYGPALTSKPIDYIAGGYYWGVVFESHVFMPSLPKQDILNAAIELPRVDESSFLFNGQEVDIPTYDTAEVFVDDLVRRGLILADELIAKALAGTARLSERSMQRRMVRTIGLSRTHVQQIERARHAFALLTEGKPIAEVAAEAGYVDQPHLTKSLKLLAGQTPAEILADYNPK